MATRHWFGAVVVWQITPENQIEYEHLIQADHEGGWQVAFSPAGRYLAAISIRGTVRVFDTATFVERFHFPHPKSIYCVCWNHDESLLMTGTESDGVRIFRSSDGTLVNHICKDVAVHALALSPNGKYLAVGGSDNVIRLLNCSDWTVVHKFLGHRDSVENLVFSPEGSYLVSGDRRDEVRCWQMSDGTPAAISGSHTFLSWQGHGSRVWEIGYHPTQPKFATAGHDGNVHVWDDRDGQCVDTFSIGAPVLGVAYSTDAKSLAISRSVSGSSDLAYSSRIIHQRCLRTFCLATGRRWSRLSENIVFRAHRPRPPHGSAMVQVIEGRGRKECAKSDTAGQFLRTNCWWAWRGAGT